MKTTFADRAKPNCEQREYQVKHSASQIGRSSIYFDCPFCGAEVTAFIWSLPNGKRCHCGALFAARGIGWKLKSAACTPQPHDGTAPAAQS